MGAYHCDVSARFYKARTITVFTWPRFVCLLLSQLVHPSLFCGSCEGWVTLRSFRHTLHSTFCLANPSLLSAVSPLSALISKWNTARGRQGYHCLKGRSFKVPKLHKPLGVSQILQLILSLSPCYDLTVVTFKSGEGWEKAVSEFQLGLNMGYTATATEQRGCWPHVRSLYQLNLYVRSLKCLLCSTDQKHFQHQTFSLSALSAGDRSWSKVQCQKV